MDIEESKSRLESFKNVLGAYTDQNYSSVFTTKQETVDNETIEDRKITNHFESILIPNKGAAYNKFSTGTRYHDPIISTEPYKGNSRIAADLTLEKQERSIEDFVLYCRKHREFVRWSSNPSKNNTTFILTDHFISYCIAIMRLESGFNIDAAAGTTSASSYFQFVKKTGLVYGLNDSNVWDFIPNIKAGINHTIDNYEIVQRNKLGEEYIYKIHHDGNFKNSGEGLALAKDKIMPMLAKIEPLVISFEA